MGIHLYQQQPIYLSVDLQCQAGELLALVGPSGSGKTTIIRAIAGLYHVAQGRVICGDSVWQDSTKSVFLATNQRHVGVVLQQYALFPHMTVLHNILQALNDVPVATRNQQALALLAQVHLSGLEHRYPRQLSGGQQQRVAVARALARRPKILLLDEPFAAVDQVTRRKLYRELLLLKAALDIPIILVTHDLEEASLLADRMALLYKGDILQTDTPAMLALKPKTATIAHLMEQKNIFTATVIAQERVNNITQLQWRGMRLEADYQANFTVNETVCWCIAAAHILLHRRGRPSNGDRENPLVGTIVEYFEINGIAYFLVDSVLEGRVQLSVNVPLHVAKRNQLALHVNVGLSLLAEGIHLMPYQASRYVL